ncbi:MAG: hypothetical protein DRG27_00625 [Deltaproteobacteria bacterium]|nr:MAG: hypothetical protein DRG27_00625 [Deltaproteobacteria bacterium]
MSEKKNLKKDTIKELADLSLEELKEREEELLARFLETEEEKEDEKQREETEDKETQKEETAKEVEDEEETETENEEGTETKNEEETETEAETEEEEKETAEEEKEEDKYIKVGDFLIDKESGAVITETKLGESSIKKAIPLKDLLEQKPKVIEKLPEGITEEDIKLAKELKNKKDDDFDFFNDDTDDTAKTEKKEEQSPESVMPKDVETRISALAETDPETLGVISQVYNEQLLPENVLGYVASDPVAFDFFTELVRSGDFAKYYDYAMNKYQTDRSFRYASRIQPLTFFQAYVESVQKEQQAQKTLTASASAKQQERRTTSRIPNATSGRDELPDLESISSLDELKKIEDKVLDKLLKE